MSRKDLINKIFEVKEASDITINKKEIFSFIDGLFSILFEKNHLSKDEIESTLSTLENGLCKILGDVEIYDDCQNKSSLFFQRLGVIYNNLLDDAEFILNSDPAAQSIDEVHNSYLGFFAIAVYRFAHELIQLDVKLIPRVFAEYAHSKTGVDIHPGAVIGTPFFIDHGTGIVIGETTIIGNNVKIYQGVTLGALSVSKDKASVKRHPTIKDGVVIYSGATILGGDTVVGENTVIGGNVWLTNSVDSKNKIFHKSQIIVKENDQKTKSF